MTGLCPLSRESGRRWLLAVEQNDYQTSEAEVAIWEMVPGGPVADRRDSEWWMAAGRSSFGVRHRGLGKSPSVPPVFWRSGRWIGGRCPNWHDGWRVGA
jgi:hypothetical protein